MPSRPAPKTFARKNAGQKEKSNGPSDPAPGLFSRAADSTSPIIVAMATKPPPRKIPNPQNQLPNPIPGARGARKRSRRASPRAPSLHPSRAREEAEAELRHSDMLEGTKFYGVRERQLSLSPGSHRDHAVVPQSDSARSALAWTGSRCSNLEL